MIALFVSFRLFSIHGRSQAENVCFGASFVKQASVIALPLLLILTCLVEALYHAKYISMPHQPYRLSRLAIRPTMLLPASELA